MERTYSVFVILVSHCPYWISGMPCIWGKIIGSIQKEEWVKSLAEATR